MSTLGDHFSRNRYRYLAGAVGLVAGRKLLSSYARNPGAIESNLSNFAGGLKDVGKEVKNQTVSAFRNTDQDIKQSLANLGASRR